MASLDQGSELLEGVSSVAASFGITCGVFSAIGALSFAEIAFYDQSAHIYRNRLMEEPVELISCQGNISSRGEKPFVHAHVSLAGRDYRVYGGHLVRGSVFSAEVHLRDLGKAHLVRMPDFATGLHLWADEP
ncbi:MAG: hypothetical protein A4E47_00119 [Methanosaeta sp. PtaU1.Bin028]|nr:MAG: hypothetical protein A4E47_00119 [Methanosaeta sp. PtaU1.Bin028]